MEQTGFRKSLNLIDSTAIVAGSMIGSGIFIVSAEMSRNLGSPGWLLVAWAITGVMTIAAALSYGELASMMPKAGGQYVYLREAFNPLSGFLYGWTFFLVIQTGTIAAVGMAFAKFFGVLVPWFSEKNILLDLRIVKVSAVHVLAIGSILILTCNNLLGIRNGKWVQNIFTVLKAVLLLAFILLGLFVVRNTAAIQANASFFWKPQSATGEALSGWALIAAIGVAMVGSLFSSDAWNNITFAAGEVKNPKRNIPVSLALGVIIVTVLYLLANFAYLNALPLRGNSGGQSVSDLGMQYAVNDRLGSAMIYALFGPLASILMAGFVVISTFGCNNGLILSGARVYYAMANDKLFFRQTGELNRFGVPGKALVIQAVWASLLCLSGTYSNLLDYVVFAVLIFYVLTIAGIFRLRKTKPDAERPYKAFGYPVVPVIYMASAILIMMILLIYRPVYTWPGLLIVLTGIPVYFLWRKFSPAFENCG
ncbi:MAG TPA: amino acid permease [Bacteroidales bacterium]|nr:amino acid permease [Bacteroidales bacterium]HPT01473.1 amino acid permease [Bacteroidales bacterium]